MTSQPVKYVVITPARDEQAYLRLTIESMVAQTIRPMEWIMVNDGSTAQTGEVIDERGAGYRWIRWVNRTSPGFR